MAVYVDSMRPCIINKNWKYHENCHMFADSKSELITFAVSIGLKPQWIQSNPIHFDLTKHMRTKALKKGAIQINRNKTLELIKTK